MERVQSTTSAYPEIPFPQYQKRPAPNPAAYVKARRDLKVACQNNREIVRIQQVFTDLMDDPRWNVKAVADDLVILWNEAANEIYDCLPPSTHRPQHLAEPRQSYFLPARSSDMASEIRRYQDQQMYVLLEMGYVRYLFDTASRLQAAIIHRVYCARAVGDVPEDILSTGFMEKFKNTFKKDQQQLALSAVQHQRLYDIANGTPRSRLQKRVSQVASQPGGRRVGPSSRPGHPVSQQQQPQAPPTRRGILQVAQSQAQQVTATTVQGPHKPPRGRNNAQVASLQGQRPTANAARPGPRNIAPPSTNPPPANSLEFAQFHQSIVHNAFARGQSSMPDPFVSCGVQRPGKMFSLPSPAGPQSQQLHGRVPSQPGRSITEIQTEPPVVVADQFTVQPSPMPAAGPSPTSQFQLVSNQISEDHFTTQSGVQTRRVPDHPRDARLAARPAASDPRQAPRHIAHVQQPATAAPQKRAAMDQGDAGPTTKRIRLDGLDRGTSSTERLVLPVTPKRNISSQKYTLSDGDRVRNQSDATAPNSSTSTRKNMTAEDLKEFARTTLLPKKPRSRVPSPTKSTPASSALSSCHSSLFKSCTSSKDSSAHAESCSHPKRQQYQAANVTSSNTTIQSINLGLESYDTSPSLAPEESDEAAPADGKTRTNIAVYIRAAAQTPTKGRDLDCEAPRSI